VLRHATLTSLAVLLHLGCLACGEDRGALETPVSLDDWRAHRSRLDATVWADEKSGDPAAKGAVLASVDLEALRLGARRSPEWLPHGIQVFGFGPPHRTLTAGDWAALVGELTVSGHRLVQSEWHHARFFPPEDGAPPRSLVAVVLHVVDDALERRIVVEGDLAVEWSDRRDASGAPIPAKIDATGLRMLVRAGPSPFERILSYERRLAGGRSGIHPVLVYDLDKDGLSEIVSVGSRRVLWNRGQGRFAEEDLLAHPFALTETGAIADLNGDSHPDLISTRARGDLVIYPGDAEGRFRAPPLVSPHFEYPLRAPSVISVGDVDGDGDLDAWLAQYKPPYQDGQMPSPFYDANDGYPAYLLRNDGRGGLTDATAPAGLAPKRFRRTYASSFVDLDEDADLDLLVVSDYSGVDLHHNDGGGHFSDANDTLRADRHLFGMSAAFGDYDVDGRLDFFVAGMASTTARRLEHLGLEREDRPDIHENEMRMRMAFGNRMYLARDSGWQEPAFAGEVARTGWTWGTTTLDFDNDGDPDLFAANGHVSGESTEDYCANFWTHDIYDGVSEPNEALGSLFAEVGSGLRSGEASWDGYQKNKLLMNREGKGFVDVAFLLGVADEFDSRSAVSEDLDLDGRVDLIVVEDHGAEGQKLHVYRNRLETGNRWIGVRLVEEGGGISPVGASVLVRTAEQVHVGRVVTGDTLMGQHSATLHFGLGEAERVDAIEVRWVGGASRTVRDPEIGRYHLVRASGEGARADVAGSGP
jgi:hypothetical protein